jgi:hypothetical protein
MTRGAPDYEPWTAFQRFQKTGGATLYESTFTVPYGISEGNAISEDFILEKGFLIHISLRFPPGSCGGLHIAIYDQATRIFPPLAGTWFIGNDETINFYTEYDAPLVGDEYKLVLKGWNEDEVYPHCAIVRMFLVRIP